MAEGRGKAVDSLAGEPPGLERRHHVSRVDQGNQSDLFALALQLPSYLEGNHAAGTHPPQEIGAPRLDRSDLVDVISGHLGDSGMSDWNVFAGKGWRPKTAWSGFKSKARLR